MESLTQVILMDMGGSKLKKNKILLMISFGFLKEEKNKTLHLTTKNMGLHGTHYLDFVE